MAFKPFEKIEAGEEFRYRGRIWVKVPRSEFVDPPFNAVIPEPTEVGVTDVDLVKSVLVDEMALVNIVTESELPIVKENIVQLAYRTKER